MRVLAVDFGFKRIGIAVADDKLKIAGTRPVIDASGALRNDADKIAELARKEQAEMVVIGLPIEPQGTEGRMARICRTLGAHLELSGLKVAFMDESLSSVEAEGRLLGQNFTAAQRKKRRDGEAAALILERYLNEIPPSP